MVEIWSALDLTQIWRELIIAHDLRFGEWTSSSLAALGLGSASLASRPETGVSGPETGARTLECSEWTGSPSGTT